MDRRRAFMTVMANQESIVFSQDFSVNSGLSGWTVPGTAAVTDGALVITPTAGAELFTDPGLEATYTAGLCASLGKQGTPTLAESADVHGGSKAQSFTATANSDFARYVGPASISGRWYLASMWAKRTAGTAGTTFALLLHANGTGISVRKKIESAAYVQYILANRAFSTNQMCLFANQSGAAPFDTVIVDDFSMKLLTTSTMGIFRPANSTSYQVGIVPAVANIGQPYGVWVCVDNPSNPLNGILAWYSGFTNIALDKYVNGVITNLVSVAKLYDTGNTVEGVRNGNDYSLFLGGTQVGTTQSNITDIGNCPYVGVFSATPTNTIHRFDKQSYSYAVNVWGFGDSKIQAIDGPMGKLGAGVREVPTRVGVAGQTVAQMKARVDADLAAATGTPNFVFINLGTNDFGSNSTTWKTNYAYILDAIHTKWADARIGVTVPWSVGNDANSDTRATDLGVVLSTRSWAGIAVDERTIIKPYADRLGADNVHPTTLGYFYEAVSLRSWMGI